jgi:hypothetical protein
MIRRSSASPSPDALGHQAKRPRYENAAQISQDQNYEDGRSSQRDVGENRQTPKLNYGTRDWCTFTQAAFLKKSTPKEIAEWYDTIEKNVMQMPPSIERDQAIANLVVARDKARGSAAAQTQNVAKIPPQQRL